MEKPPNFTGPHRYGQSPWLGYLVWNTTLQTGYGQSRGGVGIPLGFWNPLCPPTRPKPQTITHPFPSFGPLPRSTVAHVVSHTEHVVRNQESKGG